MELTQKLGAAAGAVALSLGASALAQDAVQWRVEDGGNGHWYAAVVFPTAITWVDARLDAESRGGGLACLTSPMENNWVHAHIASNPTAWNQTASWLYGPWIGGYRGTATDEHWKWVSGEPWNFSSWHPSQPDSAIQTVVSFGGAGVTGATWADTEPDEPVVAYIIEWSSDCDSDGIVDFGQILAGELADANRNNVPDCCEGAGSCNCPGDVARDGVVNGIDLAAVLNNWGTSGGDINADANGDGIVDAEDLALVLSGWGDCP
jgi:hypothetical protein